MNGSSIISLAYWLPIMAELPNPELDHCFQEYFFLIFPVLTV
jgi:hypothetical protein